MWSWPPAGAAAAADAFLVPFRGSILPVVEDATRICATKETLKDDEVSVKR